MPVPTPEQDGDTPAQPAVAGDNRAELQTALDALALTSKLRDIKSTENGITFLDELAIYIDRIDILQGGDPEQYEALRVQIIQFINDYEVQ